MKILDSIIITADLITKTGLHIGSGRENIEIGGLDLPIIKNPKTDLPYIPGSSLKGKLRFLTEWEEDCVNKSGEVCKCGSSSCCVCRMFGSTNNKENDLRGPTRLIVRDAELKKPETFDRDKHIEIKWENTIDRTTGTAKNPRPLERVVPDVTFAFKVIYKVFNIEDDEGKTDYKYFTKFVNSLRLLENDTLGGSGSRGCGQIMFNNIKVAGYDNLKAVYDTIAELYSDINRERV